MTISIQQSYHNRVVLLQNLLSRIVSTRGRDRVYSLKGTITQEERNALVVALDQLKIKSHSLRLFNNNEEDGEKEK